MLLFILSCFIVLLLIVYKYLDDKIDENGLHRLAYGCDVDYYRFFKLLRDVCISLFWFVLLLLFISLF